MVCRQSMGRQMKVLVRIICVSAIVLVAVARIGADDVQTPGLFDQVRDGIKNLKPGMKYEEVKRILQIEKLELSSVGGGIGGFYSTFEFPRKPDQRLYIHIPLSDDPNETIV